MRKTTAVISAAAIAALAGVAAADKAPSNIMLEGMNGVTVEHGAAVTYVVGRTNFTVIDVSGIDVYFGFNNPLNTVLNQMLSANAHVFGIGWDVNQTANSPSWLSEMRIEFTDSAITTGVGLSPSGTGGPGTESNASAGIVDLIGLGLDFNVGADGILRVEFWDTFADFDGTGVEGTFNSGTVTIAWIPAPSSVALLGLGGLVAARRRR